MIESIQSFAQAAVRQRQNCSSSQVADNCLSVLPEVKANDAQLKNGLMIAFGIFAAVAVIVIIIAAINYAASEGDPEKISRSKKTIIYALIGLVIALSAEAIVITLLGRL